MPPLDEITDSEDEAQEAHAPKPNPNNMMTLHGGTLCAKPPVKKKTVPPPKKAAYTGQSKRSLRRKQHAAKKRKLEKVLKSVAPIRTYFQKQTNTDRPSRKCVSYFSSKNNLRRAIKQQLSDKNKRKTPAVSTKGHKQKSAGAVSIRPRKRSRHSRKTLTQKVFECMPAQHTMMHTHARTRTRTHTHTHTQRLRELTKSIRGVEIV